MKSGDSLPFYRPLTPDKMKKINQTARRLLAEVGIRLGDPAFLPRLQAAGARVDADRQLIFLDGPCLDDLLNRAPQQFTLFSRDGANDLRVGRRESFFGNGGRVFRILDLSTGGYRETLLRDIANTATLVDHLENISFYIIACQAHDVPEQYYHYNDFYQAFNHTSKHVMGGCDSIAGAHQLCELAGMIAGDADALRRRPIVSVITNVTSPLTIDATTLAILDFCTARGIPVTCATAPIAGATAPITLAGTLTQMHAEALAGVAVTQALTPGARVLYGAFPIAMDLRTSEVTVGSVEMGMMNASAVALARMYRLPIYASGGVTEAKRPDIQAGFEKNFSDLTVAMSHGDIIHLTAGMVDSCNSISYEQFVIDNESLGMIKRVLRGITVNDDMLAYDTIREVGPGGNFLSQGHTVAHMRHEYYLPKLSVRCNFDAWQRLGEPDVMTRANERVHELLDRRREGILETSLIMEIKKTFPQIQSI